MSPKHSSERMTDEIGQLRATVLWLAEHTPIQRSPSMLHSVSSGLLCGDCGHDVEHHVGHPPEDGSTCLFPQTLGAPHPLCQCRRFLGDEV